MCLHMDGGMFDLISDFGVTISDLLEYGDERSFVALHVLQPATKRYKADC
jgi:hypothetical protein